MLKIKRLATTKTCPNHFHLIAENSSLHRSFHIPLGLHSLSSDDSLARTAHTSHFAEWWYTVPYRSLFFFLPFSLSLFLSPRSFHRLLPPWTPRRSYFACFFFFEVPVSNQISYTKERNGTTRKFRCFYRKSHHIIRAIGYMVFIIYYLKLLYILTVCSRKPQFEFVV